MDCEYLLELTHRTGPDRMQVGCDGSADVNMPRQSLFLETAVAVEAADVNLLVNKGGTTGMISRPYEIVGAGFFIAKI